MYIYYLANRDHELQNILEEYTDLNINNGFPPQDLEDVIDHIEEI